MFVKLGNSYTISILVADTNGVRITNDSPHVIIRNISKEVYWNGISWTDSEFRIYLEHVLNGVYQYVFTPDSADLYEVSVTSETYQVSKTETIEVYSEDFASYQWMIGNEFTIKYPVTDISVIPQVRICKETNQTYWDGTLWNLASTYLQMVIIDGNVALYHFVPSEEGKYHITIKDGQNETLMILQATSVADNVAPVVVTNLSLKSLDGSNCTMVTESGNALPGVKISVYDLVAKSLISQAASDIAGGWSLILKPGKYYFVFEKDGYSPVGMQRVVS